MLETTTAWRDPASFKDGQRSFEEFVVLYSALRIGREGRPGVSHTQAVALLKATAKTVVPGRK